LKELGISSGNSEPLKIGIVSGIIADVLVVDVAVAADLSFIVQAGGGTEERNHACLLGLVKSLIMRVCFSLM